MDRRVRSAIYGFLTFATLCVAMALFLVGPNASAVQRFATVHARPAEHLLPIRDPSSAASDSPTGESSHTAAAQFIAPEPESSSARRDLQRAWGLAGDIGKYRYHTTVVQTLHPVLSLDNVGRTARTDQYVIEGEMDAPAGRMTLQMAVTNQPPLQIKVENGRGYGRATDADPWTETEIATDLFAPGGDPMGFLAAAENVRRVDGESQDAFFATGMLPPDYAQSVTRYQFDMSGAKYAQLMRAEMEDYLRTRGALPAGLSLQMTQQYVDMTGGGEIWINSDGLPVRQILRLAFPSQPGAREWAEAEITTEFSGWAQKPAGALALNGDLPRLTLGGMLGREGARQVQQASSTVGMLLVMLALAALALRYRHSLPVSGAIYAVIIFSMVVAPLLQSTHTAAAYSNLAEIQARNADRQPATSTEERPPLNPHQIPLAQAQQSPAATTANQTNLQSPVSSLQSIASTCVITATSDCDGDGLTDNVEIYELGTRIDQIDTDGEGISDKTEVTPVTVGGQTWYMDPLNPDSNGDGLTDGVECFGRSDVITTTLLTPLLDTCDDADSDGVPNVYDFDDDGDGVPDSADLAPLDSQAVVSQTFNLEIAGATPDTNLFVDFQVRPLDERHLWWANSTLNWPNDDDQGQIRRVTTDTLTADGDMLLIPMLEITIPYSPTNPAGGLPITPTVSSSAITQTAPLADWLDTTLLDSYGINVTLNENGDRIVYAPLVQATDPNGDSPVAWQTRMSYRLAADAGGWGASHRVKVIWLVSGQRDTCAPPEGTSYAAYCQDKDHVNWTSETRILQTYYDDFVVTGLRVQEHHGAEALMAAQTANTGIYEPDLWHLADTLQQVYLNAQEVTTGQRFDLGDVSTTASQWGLGGKLAFNHLTGLVDDAALLASTSGDAVPAFLRTIYTSDPVSGTVASVLLLSESSARTRTLGEVDIADGDPPITTERFAFADNTFHVDLNATDLNSVGSMRQQTYRFTTGGGWSDVAPNALLADLTAALESTLTPAVMTDLLGGDAVSDPAKARDGAILMALNTYLALYVASAEVLAINGVSVTGIPLVNTDHVRPAEPAAAIVQRLATGLKEYFALIDGSILNIPTVDANKPAGTADAWAALAASRGTVLEGFGDVLQGNSASAAALGLLEISNYPTTVNGGDLLDLRVYAILDTFISDFVSGVVIPSVTGQEATQSTSGLGDVSGGGLLTAGSMALSTGFSAVLARNYDHTLIRSLGKLQDWQYGKFSTLKKTSTYGAFAKARELLTEAQSMPDGPIKTYRIQESQRLNAQAQKYYSSVITDKVKAWSLSGLAAQIASSGLTLTLALASGRVQADSPAFSRLLADQIGAIIVETFLAILSLVAVTAGIFALSHFLFFLSIIDGVMMAVCSAFHLGADANFNRWFCGGISGAIANALSYVINDTTPLVDLKRSDRLDVVLDTPTFGNESGQDGVLVGNSVTLSGTVTNTLYMDDPNWMGYLWWWQWSDNNLDNATFAYRMQQSKQDIPLDLNGTSWIDVPGKKSSSISANDARFYQSIPIQPLVHTFTAPGINQGLPVYFSEGFAVPMQNCWLTVVGLLITCWVSEFDDTNHFALDNSFYFDVLPNTLDAFRTTVLDDAGKGYRLAWDKRFPTLADADGDGLRSQAVGGIDPNDNTPDMDADGLSDYFEMNTKGFDATQADGDCDGLTDYWELFYGTDPTRTDTDGDGLLDGEEFFHPNRLNPYENSVLSNSNPPTCATSAAPFTGGWPIVYDYDSSGNPLSTWVSADPNDPDSDDDTLSDKQERIYAYNPNVASRLNVLGLDSTIETSSSLQPYVAPTGVITYTAVVTNELALPYARGLLEAELPLDSVLRYQSLGIIAPRTAVTLTGNLGVAAAGLTSSGPVDMGIRAGAIIEDPTGRALWLHMNEPVGSTTFVDSSFLGNNGACSGASCPTATGSALTFDGGDVVSIPDDETLDLTQYTLAMAIKPTQSSPSVLLTKTSGDGSAQNYSLSFSANQVQFFTFGGCAGEGGINSIQTPALPLNQWSHIAATYDGSTKRLYLNGMEVASASFSGAACLTNDPVTIGGRDFLGSVVSGFTGQIDEVEIYPSALDANTVAARYSRPILTVDLRDSANWGSDAVSCSGAACPSVGGGSGATFAQVDYLTATAPDLSGDAFTFVTWIKPKARTHPFDAGAATAFGKWTDADYQGVFGARSAWDGKTIYPSLYVGSNGRLRMIWGDGATTCEVSTVNTGVLTLDAWQHLTVSYDGSNLVFYINGAPISGGTTGSCAAVTPPTVGSFSIGRPNPFGYLHFDYVDFDKFQDPRGAAGGHKVEMRLNFDNDGSAGSVAWANLDEGTSNTPSWALDKTRVLNDASNSWFRLWENYDGGCFIECPEDESTDTNFDTSGTKPDHNLKQITGIKNVNYLGSWQSIWIYTTSLLRGTLYWSNNNDFFQGELDDFAVYATALDAERVAQLYNANYVSLDLPFDEAPGATLFADDSGNFTSVACSGASCPTSGVPGRRNQALDFDGVDDYLLLGSSTDELGFTSGDFSVMMWIKPDDFLGAGGLGLVPLMEIGAYNYVGLYNGRMTVQGAVLAQDKDTLYNATGRWYHLAYVYDKAKARYTLYLNGRAIWQQSYGVPDATTLLQIGRWSALGGANYYYNGLMDDLTVVKRALTQTEIQAHFDRAPAVNLHLDEDLSLTSFADDSNNRFIATCTSTAACPGAGDKGQMREAVTFDGNDTLTLAATSAVTLTNFSVSLWVKPTKRTRGAQRLLTKSNTSQFDANFRLWLLGNSMIVRFDRQSACANAEANWNTVDAASPLLEDQWNHVVATHDAANQVMRIYVNGALAGATTGIGSAICTAANPIRLGQGFTGGMDEVSVFKTVLDAGQVAAMYNYQSAWFDVIDQHQIYVDADLPTVDMSLTPATVSAAETVLALSVADASSQVTKVEYRINGGAWQSAAPSTGDATTSSAWLYYFQAGAGAHTIEARATDVVGNVSAIASANVRVDDGAPALTINSTGGVLAITESTVISGTVSDTDSGVVSNAVQIAVLDHTGAAVTGNRTADLGASNTWQATQPFLEAPYGVYTATAQATDGAGNQASASAPLKLDGRPPYADVTDGENYLSPLATKTIAGIASDVPYPPNGRTLHLHFETGSGLWEDGSQTGFTMQCTAPACPTSGVTGQRGKAVTFDGSDDVLAFGGNEAITTTTTAQQLGLADGSFTVMAWVNASSWSGGQALLGSNPSTASEGLFVGVQNGSPILGYGSDDTVMTGTIPTGQWVHLAWRFDAASGQRAFFVNGELGAADSGGHIPFSAEDAILMGTARGGNALAATVDEVVIYAQALADETIYDIANPIDVGVSSLEARIRTYDQRDFGQYEGTWTPVTLDTANSLFTTWQMTLPALPVGAYKIDLRGTDNVGNRQFVEGAWDFAITAPDMAVSKGSSVSLAGLGDSVGFTVTYTNAGAVAATNVIITETVPVDAAFDPALSHPGWACAAGGVAGSACTLAVGDVAVGAGGVVSFTVTVGSAWSAGTTAIANTATIGADGGESTPADNTATARVPVDAQIDLAVTMTDGGTSFQYSTEGSTPVTYTMFYTNTGTQPAQPRLTAAWSQGGERDPFDPDTNWVCVTDPYTLAGYHTCTRDLGTLGIGQSGSVTFTLYTGYFLPDSLLITNTVTISDAAGGNEVNTANNVESVTTPIQVDYAVVLGQSAITVPEGSVVTNTGRLIAPPSDPTPLFSFYPPPSVGVITDIDEVNLTWSWVYTSADGPDQSQIVNYTVAIGDGSAFVLRPSFLMTVTNVPPTVVITTPDTVAVGQELTVAFGDLVDPGQDTMTDCVLNWGDGTSDYCYSAIGGGLLFYIYGASYANPTMTVIVTDEDGEHVAATKTLTVTGVTTSLQADQSSVSGYESQIVTNTGTYSPLDASLSWSASEGTVTDEGDGVWSWSLPAGSAEGSRTVTIQAGSLNTNFTVTVLGDGVPDGVEEGAPNGGDGNYDGIPDSTQMNVASVASPLTGQYMTVAAAEGMTLTQVSLSATPSAGDGSQSNKVKFPLGYLNFTLAGLAPGGSTSVTLFMTDTVGIKTYYKYSAASGWSRFNYASGTGAEILSDRIILYFVDGGRGDADGLANGVIVDPGGPAYELDEYLLTVATSGNGSVSEITGLRPAGTVVTLTATADPGWSFSGWSGALTGSAATQSLTINQDKSVTAIFTRNQYSLARRVVGSGSVTASPNQGSYVYGDVLSIAATPATGWRFSGWSGALSGSTATQSLTMDSSKVVTATFTQNQYTLNTGVSGNGSIIRNPDQITYVYGDVVSVQAAPDPGYAFQSWSGDLSGSGGGQNLTIDGNKSVTALFVTAVYTVGTSVAGNGSIVLDPDQATYAYGDVISVTAVPAKGWHFAEWQAGLSGVTATQALTITDSTNVVALFEPDNYNLNTGWIGNGSVVVDPDKDQYVVGEVVTITAVPDTGYAFLGWSEEFTDTLFSTGMTTTLTMTENKSILANFGLPTYPLNVYTDGTGSGVVISDPPGIDCGADCSEPLSIGAVITLTATTDPDSTFAGWSGDMVSAANPVTLTMDSSKLITATFKGIPTGVTLGSFSVQGSADRVAVTWDTANEASLAGFNLYRSDAAAGPQILLAFVPALTPGGAQGHAYSYDDVAVGPTKSYWYTLEVVSVTGALTSYGPVGVTLSSFGQQIFLPAIVNGRLKP